MWKLCHWFYKLIVVFVRFLLASVRYLVLIVAQVFCLHNQVPLDGLEWRLCWL